MMKKYVFFVILFYIYFEIDFFFIEKIEYNCAVREKKNKRRKVCSL